MSKFVYETEEDREEAQSPDIIMSRNVLSNVTSLRYRKKQQTLLSSPIKRTRKTSSIKKSSVSSIIWSVRRSLRGSQLFNKRGGTIRINNENVKENGWVVGRGTLLSHCLLSLSCLL